MDSARGYYSHFTQQAFVWKASFSQRQIVRYESENTKHVQKQLEVISDEAMRLHSTETPDTSPTARNSSLSTQYSI